jgi:hypothetical protein
VAVPSLLALVVLGVLGLAALVRAAMLVFSLLTGAA